MAVSEDRWDAWVKSWNGMKAPELEDYILTNDEATLVKIAPKELQEKLVLKYKRLTGKDFPIELGDNQAESKPEPDVEPDVMGLPTQGSAEVAAIDAQIRANMVEGEVGRQADLLDKADEVAMTKKVLLTEQQQLIASLVDAAEKEAPRISVSELGQRLMMLIPKVIKESRPDYAYKWASADNLQTELHTFGGHWEIVARVNHPHLPEALFGPEGSIMYKGASILVFTRRSITDFLDKQTIGELDLRVRESTQAMDRTYRDARGKEQVRLEIIDKEPPNKVGEQALTTATYGPGGDYDYPDVAAG